MIHSDLNSNSDSLIDAKLFFRVHFNCRRSSYGTRSQKSIFINLYHRKFIRIVLYLVTKRSCSISANQASMKCYQLKIPKFSKYK